MAYRGRCMDNIFIERLWRSLKYEAVYLYERHGRLQGGMGHRRVGSTCTILFHNTHLSMLLK